MTYFALSEACLLASLYIVAFGAQLVGVGLVVWEIRDDVRAARALKERPALSAHLGGIGLQGLVQAARESDSFRDFTADRLSRGLGRRIWGVVLFLVGAGVGLAANLVATL